MFKKAVLDIYRKNNFMDVDCGQWRTFLAMNIKQMNGICFHLFSIKGYYIHNKSRKDG